MYFRKCRLGKTWLNKCLKSRVLEDPSTNNMANGSKHCCNLNKNTFTIFINYSEGNALEKGSFSDMENPKTLW